MTVTQLCKKYLKELDYRSDFPWISNKLYFRLKSLLFYVIEFNYFCVRDV